MMLSVTVFVDNTTNYAAVPRQLLSRLDTIPGRRGLRKLKSGRADDRLAAVLVPLIWRNSEWQILMTKRAAHLSHHAGEISFPGGALCERDKRLIDAALREAHEEVNLTPSSVRIIGGLVPVRSPVGFIVQPIVGIVCGNNFDDLWPNPDEVESIFTLPLAHISQPGNFLRVLGQIDGRVRSFWVVSHPEYYIWGLSARVLNDLRQRLHGGQT